MHHPASSGKLSDLPGMSQFSFFSVQSLCSLRLRRTPSTLYPPGVFTQGLLTQVLQPTRLRVVSIPASVSIKHATEYFFGGFDEQQNYKS